MSALKILNWFQCLFSAKITTINTTNPKSYCRRTAWTITGRLLIGLTKYYNFQVQICFGSSFFYCLVNFIRSSILISLGILQYKQRKVEDSRKVVAVHRLFLRQRRQRSVPCEIKQTQWSIVHFGLNHTLFCFFSFLGFSL